MNNNSYNTFFLDFSSKSKSEQLFFILSRHVYKYSNFKTTFKRGKKVTRLNYDKLHNFQLILSINFFRSE